MAVAYHKQELVNDRDELNYRDVWSVSTINLAGKYWYKPNLAFQGSYGKQQMLLNDNDSYSDHQWSFGAVIEVIERGLLTLDAKNLPKNNRVLTVNFRQLHYHFNHWWHYQVSINSQTGNNTIDGTSAVLDGSFYFTDNTHAALGVTLNERSDPSYRATGKHYFHANQAISLSYETTQYANIISAGALWKF